MTLTYLIAVIWLVLATAAVVDCVKANNQNKFGWIAVIVLVPLLGAFLYFRSGRGRTVSEL